MNTQFFTFEELEHASKAIRQAFGLTSKKDLRSAAADLHHSDPDYIRMPAGSLLAFTENGGIVATLAPLSVENARLLDTFFREDYAENFTLLDCSSWDAFGGSPNDTTAPTRSQYARIAYRGGQGAAYTLYIAKQ